MFGPFRLNSKMSRASNVDPNDTLRTKHALRGIGYYDPGNHGMSQYPEGGMFKAIESFQSDHGLRKDGYMNPGGETERTIRGVTNAMEREYLTGTFVSTVAIADAVVAVQAAVVVGSVVLGAGPDDIGSGEKNPDLSGADGGDKPGGGNPGGSAPGGDGPGSDGSSGNGPGGDGATENVSLRFHPSWYLRKSQQFR